ncbi:hypothetical protein P7C70_g5681, partial [Phenoliferia sp. Uapishka_3]
MAPLAPYLGSRANLSLFWLTQTFLALLLLAISLYLLLVSIPYLVKDAKQVFTSACHGAEDAADVVVSLPHYLADNVNELNAKAVNLVTTGAKDGLDFGLLAIQEIALFMIDLYRSLFLCLLDLVVHGSLDLVIAGVKEAEDFITSAFQDVRSEILVAITGINEGLNSSVALIDRLPGVDLKAPQITMPTLSALNNVTLPTGIVDSLTSLNSTIPTLAEFRASLDSIISTPITLLRSTINSTLSNSTITISQLPVPAKESVDLCSNIDTSWIDDVGHTLTKSIHVSFGVLAAVTIIILIGYYFYERYRYQAFLGAVEHGRNLWQSSLGESKSATLETPHLLAFLSSTSHPRISSYISRFTSNRRLGPDWTSSIFWFANYVCHPNALMFLALGVVGIIGVEIQLAVVEGPIRSLARESAESGAGNFAKSLVAEVDGIMGNSSASFAKETNAVITGIQDGINDNLFSWVNTTTTAINSTLNTFYDGLTSAVTLMFNGTVLEDPALDLVYCLIGSKVSGVETALTFIHDHAHLSLPTVSPTILLLSSDRTTELTSSLTSPNSTVSTTSVVDSLIDRYASSLRSQRLGFILCICIWLIVLLMGILGVWWAHWGEDYYTRWKSGRKGESAYAEKSGLTSFQLAAWRRGGDSVAKPVERDVDPYAAYTFPSPPANYAPPTYNTYPPLPDNPNHRRPSYAAGASWASLIDFFKPGHDDADVSPKPLKTLPNSSNPTTSPSTRPFQMPTFQHLPSFASSGGLRSRPRRDSDTVDLRTGGYLNRPIAAGTGRIRGAVASVTGAMRGLKPGDSKLSRNDSGKSFGPGRERRWEDEAESEDETNASPILRQVAPAWTQGHEYPGMARAQEDHRNPTQMPLSPPPVPQGYPSLNQFPPMVPDRTTVQRQLSKYQPTSGRNPFVSPFDGPGDT